MLGRGEKLVDIEANMGMIIEGISTTKVAHELAQELKRMSIYVITQAIYQVIYEGKDIREAIHNMMSNEFKKRRKRVEISQPPYRQSYLLERKPHD